MDLFEQHILSAPIDQATDNVIKLMMVTDAIRKELDYICDLMCSGRIGDAILADLEQNSLKLLARLTDYQQAIRLGETYCGMKRRKESGLDNEINSLKKECESIQKERESQKKELESLQKELEVERIIGKRITEMELVWERSNCK